MPRTRKATAPPPNAIVASAARVMAGRRKNMPKGGALAWQAEAWDFLDSVGELEFYRELIANALSRCTLKVVEDTFDTDGKPITRDAVDPEALAALDALFGGDSGQGEMLGSMGGLIAVPGEAWLCGLLDPPTHADAPDMWRVLARDEVSEMGTKWQIDRGDGEPEVYGPDEVYMARIWEPHPRKWVHANSSVRSALPILRELVGLSKRQAAVIDSRLAGAGILAVPTEITFASPSTPDEDTGEDDEQQDPFMAALIEAMTTALEDQGDASSVVPLVIKAPAEHLDKIKHITLASPLDEKAIELRKELLGRLSNSLNIPAEMLNGMGDVNHWGQWFTEESSIKMHIEPVLGTIARGLTTRYLWPVLQGPDAETFDPDLRRFRIVGETANLRQRPNRSAEAQAAHKDLIITDAAWAREVGFEPEDLLVPGSEEFVRRVLQNVAGGVTTADLTAAALAALGVSIVPKASEVEGSTAPEGTALPAPEAPPALDARTPPETPVAAGGQQAEQAVALLAVSEVLVDRAVERGWNKAGKRGRTRQPVPGEDLDAALTGAWAAVPRAAALCGVDPHALQSTLDGYARTLLASGAEHDPRTLATRLVADVLNRPGEVTP